jgi:hypothetical protein
MTDRERDTMPPAGETHIPGPAKLPSEFARTERPSPVDDLARRFGDLSDALHDENGLVHRLFAELERKAAKREQRAQRRHRQVMKLLTTIANGVADLSARVSKLEPPETHAARLSLVKDQPAE